MQLKIYEISISRELDNGGELCYLLPKIAREKHVIEFEPR
jgi:hypothetical protein